MNVRAAIGHGLACVVLRPEQLALSPDAQERLICDREVWESKAMKEALLVFPPGFGLAWLGLALGKYPVGNRKVKPNGIVRVHGHERNRIRLGLGRKWEI